MKYLPKSFLCILLIIMSLLFITACDKSDNGIRGGSVVLDKVAFTMSKDTSVKIIAKVSTEANLKWSSSNEKIAKVDIDGNVLGISEGNITITATVNGGEASSCKVNVGYLPQNPILPPDWNMYIADGEPHFFNGKIYIYGSRDVSNGELPNGKIDWCSDKYNVIYSEDLINWTDAGVSFNLSDVPDAKGTRMWAPDVCYNPVDQKYYLYTCFNGMDIPFVVSTSTSPTGPFTDAKTLTFDDGTPVKGGIDPAVFIDTDGKSYIYWSGMKCAQFVDGDLTVVKKKSVKSISGTKDPFEGPSMRKVGDKYYFIYIQNNGAQSNSNVSPTRMAYMIGDSPLGPFKDKGVIISDTDYPNASNIHGSIEQFNGQWYVCYHLPVGDKKFTRVPCMELITFNEDGTINEVKPTSSGIRGAFKLGDKIQASSGVEFSNGNKDQSYNSVENTFPIMKLNNANSGANGNPYIGYKYIDFKSANAKEITLNATSENGGSVEFRLDSPTGAVITTIDVPTTKEAKNIVGKISDSFSDKHSVYIVLKSGSVDLNWFIVK